MRKLLRGRIIGIMESDLISQLAEDDFLARQKMPALSGAGTAVALNVRAFLCCRQRRRLVRVDADVHYLKLPADTPFHISGALDHAIEHQSAKHRTLVIAEHQQDRFVTKVLAQANRTPVLIAE